ncbi:hypothetical protein P8452_63742 [Trifolium repens]|nr:hypothetical protein P8452_63742 [Trifolium repens]
MAVPYTTQALVLILSIVITTFNFISCMEVTCNEKDKNALLNFKHGLSDPSKRLSSWSNEHDCCRWMGVRCNNITGRVIALNLSTPLDSPYMELSDNLDWITKLSSLEHLDLSGIDFRKETNWLEILSSLPFLSELHLENCQIDNLMKPPKRKTSFTNLQVLDLSNNNLNQEIPSWLCNLSTTLVQLDLSGNFLQGEIPQIISNLQNLKTLDLQGNQLSGPLHDSLGQLKHLEVLDLSNNTFTHSIPSSFSNLSSLRTLNLGHNQLNGTIPRSLGFLRNLQVLNLGENSLTGGIPETLGILSNLVTIDLSSNFLEGPIREKNLEKLFKLKELRLSSTKVFLSVDSRWIPVFQLEYVLLSSCGLGPKFPAWLKNQSSVKVLTMSNSGISDFAPSWFWNWTWQIEFLDLSNNFISGDLSNIFLNSSIINLSSNHFKGRLPSVSANVEVLNIANNSISGPISSSFLCEGMRFDNKLNVLDVSNNLLSGDLDIANNSLSGTIPYCVDEMKAMAGEDDFLANPLKYYYSFGFNYNNYKESLVLVPKGDELEYRDNLILVRMIDLSSNNLSGTIPFQISKLTALRFLNLSRNRLNGEIPNDMGNMKLLESVDLSLNKISGKIPTSTQLQSFEALSYTDFYIGMGVGFATGFWGICSAIFFNRTCRDAYFHFFYHLKQLI